MKELLFPLVGAALFGIGLLALIFNPHLLRKIIAINVMDAGVFLVLVSLAERTPSPQPDAVPHAMVITGIVVAISATALGLVLMLRYNAATAATELPEDRQRE